MGFSFTTIEPNQFGQVTKWDVPLADWTGIKFQNAHNDTLGDAISRATEDFIWDDNNPASPDVLNRAFGIEGEGGLKFDKPMSAQRAQLMHDRKRRELESEAYLQSASHSWHSVKAGIGFGASLIGGLSHPVDLGLSFLPFIGSEKAASEVALLGGSAWRQALQRGVITEEAALASKIPGGRLTVATIDGVLNQAVMEIPIAIQKHRDQANYTLADSAFNILAGGAFAGAVKGLGLALEKAARLWNAADPRMREALLTDTLKSTMTDEPPQAHWAFGMDEAAIKAKVEERVRAENPAIASLPPIPPDHVRLFHGEGGPEGGGTGGSFYTSSAEKAATFGPNVSWVDVPVERAQAGFQKAREAGQGGDTFILEPGDTKGAQQLQQRVEPQTHDLDAAVRDESVNNYLTAAKAEHEARIKGLVDSETQKVIDEVKRQAPAMPKEQVDRYQFKSVPDEKNVAAINEDTAEITKTILNVAQTEEQRLALETEIKAALKDLDEQPKADKAIDALLPCATERAKR